MGKESPWVSMVSSVHIVGDTYDGERVAKTIPLSISLDPRKDAQNITDARVEGVRGVTNIGRAVKVALKVDDEITWLDGVVIDVSKIQLVPYLALPTRKLAMWAIYSVRLNASGETVEPGLLELKFL